MTYLFSRKKSFFETYIRYNLYFKDIWYNFSAWRKVCLKHIPDIAYTLNMYDIFEMYTRWNIDTNQMNANNYTLWNIDDNQWHLKPTSVGVENYTWKCSLCLRVLMGETEG